ncbi:MAG: response regulator [Gammaproteobacteria bacterium]|nr:response regulator [Gammaproteobacteria bacterium]
MQQTTISSVRQTIYLLVLLILISLTSMFTLTVYSDWQHSFSQEQSRIRTLATIIANNTTQFLEQNRAVMERIARRPAIRAMDINACDPILAEFPDMFPQFANLATVDLQGDAPCSGVPQPGGKPVSVAKAGWFKQAMENPRFFAGDPFIGPITGRKVSVLIQPVRDDEGALLGLLGLPLDLELYDPRVPADQLPPGTRFGMLSNSGTLIWRNTDPVQENLIGKNIRGVAAADRILEIKDGDFKSSGSDGIERYYAAVPIPAVNWVAYIGVPSQWVADRVKSTAIQNATVGVVAVLLLFTLLLTLIRRIAQAEHDLFHAKEKAEEASRAKSIFLSNMSHELRTPLNAILGFAELLQRDATIAPKQRVNLETINRSGHHLLALINDILEISRIEAGKLVYNPKPLDLHQLITSLIDTMALRAHNDGLALSLDMAPELPQYVITDDGKLRQILLNLLSNAIKYTPHGSVAMSVTTTEGTKGERLLTITVRDTGVGIPKDQLELIFTPFFQTHHGVQVGEGTGLGLGIAKQYTELLGGALWAESEVGHGSCFSLKIPYTLPATPPQSTTQPRKVIALAEGEAHYRILIVEDKVDNQRLLRQMMESVGFEVEVATNGGEGVALFEQWHPDFIWMDMRMPVMDGYAATRKIRTLQGGEKVIICALTASAFEEERESILAAGCNDMIRKPIVTDSLFATMRQHLGVQFRYAEDEREQAIAGINRLESEGENPLATLPTALREQIHLAATALDGDRLLQLAEQIQTKNPKAAEYLRHTCSEYRFDDLLGHGEQTS